MEWHNLIRLAPECNERFVTRENCPVISRGPFLMAGVAKMRGEYIVARREPEQHTLLFSVRGEGRVMTPAGEHVISPQTLTLLPARQPFRFELNAERWDLCWFLLEDSRTWQRLLRLPQTVSYCRDAVPLYHLLSLLHYEIDGAETDRVRLLGQIEEHLSKALTQVSSVRSKRGQLLRLFADLETQLHYPWSVKELAARFHCSEPHLHRLCQQYLGTSPKQQLIQIRIERSKHLLRYTDWQIAEIANRVGYQDTFTFSKQFKKLVGAAPTSYRREEE